MTLTTNAHNMTKAEARPLATVFCDSLVFSGDEDARGKVTLFVPPSVAKATADAFNEAMQEHLAAASQRDKAGRGAGFSSHALPPRNHAEEIAQAIADDSAHAAMSGTDWS